MYNISRDKIEMVAYFPYQGVIINDGQYRRDEPCWQKGLTVPRNLVREFYAQLCQLAQVQLGVDQPDDNKVTFLFTCDRGNSFVACNFYDHEMVMLCWYPLRDDLSGVPRNFAKGSQEVFLAIQEKLKG